MKKFILLAAAALPFMAMGAHAENIDKELKHLIDSAAQANNTELLGKTLVNAANYHDEKTVELALYTLSKAPDKRDTLADIVMESGSDNAALILAALYGTTNMTAPDSLALDDMQPSSTEAKTVEVETTEKPVAEGRDDKSKKAVKTAEALNNAKAVQQQAQQQAVQPVASVNTISYGWGALTNLSMNGPNDVKFGASPKEEPSTFTSETSPN